MSLKSSASQSGNCAIPPVSPAPHTAAIEIPCRQTGPVSSGAGIRSICHLIASREHGGLEKHVADLSRWQARNTDARITVIAPPATRAPWMNRCTSYP